MYYLWIALITFFSTSGGVLLGIIIYNYRLSKNHKKERDKQQEKQETIKRQAFIEAYFELKENLEALNNILKLIEEKKQDETGVYLEQVTLEKAFSLGKNMKLNKLEFNIMDKLHTVMISKKKIEFYKKLYYDKIINHLEFRASLTDIIEDARSTVRFIESNYKDIFPDYDPVNLNNHKKRKPMRLGQAERSLSF